jgi:hypothetical protein
LLLIGVSVPIRSSGLAASAGRVNACTFQVGTRRVMRPASCPPICTVLLVCWPVLASINGSMTSSRGPVPRAAVASCSSRSPARATASANGAATSGGAAAGLAAGAGTGAAGCWGDDGGCSGGGVAQPATRTTRSERRARGDEAKCCMTVTRVEVEGERTL